MVRPAFDRNMGLGSPASLTPEFGTFVVQAPEAVRGVRLPLRMPVETIGREGSLKLVSATVSRNHARVWTADGQVFIADAGSAKDDKAATETKEPAAKDSAKESSAKDSAKEKKAEKPAKKK